MADSHPLPWEYRVEDFGGFFKHSPKPEELEEILNDWGEEGWEVIGFTYSDSSTRYRIIAKRPLDVGTRRRRNMPGETGFWR
jgi:hypothetical protein